MPYKNKQLGGKDEEETKREWISVPNPMPDKPTAMMERMQERLGGEK